MSKFILVLFLLLSSCSWICDTDTGLGNGEKLIMTAFEHYNSYNEDAYISLFDENVNFFATNGLGTTRFATGKADFKKMNSSIFKAKKTKISIIKMYEVGDWVFVHQYSETPHGPVEASVGYKITKGKIADIMVIGEIRAKSRK